MTEMVSPMTIEYPRSKYLKSILGIQTTFSQVREAWSLPCKVQDIPIQLSKKLWWQ